MRLQQSDPIFNMGVNVMGPAFNFELKNIVTMLHREEWTGGPGTPPVVKGSFGLQIGRGWRGLGLQATGNLWE